MKKTLALLGSAAALVAGFVLSPVARVQSCTNPEWVKTVPDPLDYDAKFADGVTPKVASLRLDTYDGATVVRTVNVGHPARDANGVVQIGITQGALALNKDYAWTVTAINQFESTTSDLSITCKWESTKPGKPGKPTPGRG